MIKKCILGLLISLFCLVGFSSASFKLYENMYVRDNGSYGFSPYDPGYDFNVINKGNLLTQQVGLTLRGIYLRRGTYMVWKYSDYLGGIAPFLSYTLSGDSASDYVLYQGFPTHYAICDYFSGNSIADYTLTGCSISELNSDSLVFIQSFMSGVSVSDNFSFNYKWTRFQYNSNMNDAGVLFCFSSQLYQKSMCFGITQNYGTISYVYPGFGTNGDHTVLFSGYGVSLPSSFSSLFYSSLDQSPGFVSIVGSSNTTVNVSFTGNLLYNNSCTNGYVVSEASRWYGGINNICYAGTYNTGIINDWVAYTPVETGLSYRDVYKLYNQGSYGYYSNYSDWFNSWADTMKRYKLGRVQFDIFNGQPFYLYAYFNKLYESAGIDGSVSREAYDVVNICNLALYSDYSQPYTGSYFSDVCAVFNSDSSPVVTTGEIGSIDDEEILPPGFDITPPSNVTSSGTIVSVDWSGTLSGNTNKNFDGKNFINDFYQKLQSVYQQPFNTFTGIIPGYILVFMFALILFRFLSH